MKRTDKKFDSVKMMRDIRDEINIEISKMSNLEFFEYLKRGVNDYKLKIMK